MSVYICTYLFLFLCELGSCVPFSLFKKKYMNERILHRIPDCTGYYRLTIWAYSEDCLYLFIPSISVILFEFACKSVNKTKFVMEDPIFLLVLFGLVTRANRARGCYYCENFTLCLESRHS